jgi:hypothetical protein
MSTTTSYHYTYFVPFNLAKLILCAHKGCKGKDNTTILPLQRYLSSAAPTHTFHLVHRTPISTMPASQESYTISIPLSPPPPRSLSTYSRFMHDHTKRLMEASGVSSSARSSTSSASSMDTALTNGVYSREY